MFHNDMTHARELTQKRMTIRVVVDFLLFARKYDVLLEKSWSQRLIDTMKAYTALYDIRLEQLDFGLAVCSGEMRYSALRDAECLLTQCPESDWNYLRSYMIHSSSNLTDTRSHVELIVAIMYMEFLNRSMKAMEDV